METTRAWACGLLTVAPHSISAAVRSWAYSNSPFSFGIPSGRSGESPIRPPVRPTRRSVLVVMAVLQPRIQGRGLLRRSRYTYKYCRLVLP